MGWDILHFLLSWWSSDDGSSISDIPSWVCSLDCAGMVREEVIQHVGRRDFRFGLWRGEIFIKPLRLGRTPARY
jgi:hypothetical protein